MLKNNSLNLNPSSFDYWIFDLDNTLYDVELGLFKKISQRMTIYIEKEFDLCTKEARDLQKKYYLKYGLTLRGLILEKKIDPEPFLKFVHDVEHHELKKDRNLYDLINNLNGKKFIYTNASLDHAKKILNSLGILSLFDDIFDIKKMNYIPKPEIESYKLMKNKFNLNNDKIYKSIFIEDSVLNLKPAKEIGMTTVLISNLNEDSKNYYNYSSIDYCFKNVKSFLKFIHY